MRWVIVSCQDPNVDKIESCVHQIPVAFKNIQGNLESRMPQETGSESTGRPKLSPPANRGRRSGRGRRGRGRGQRPPRGAPGSSPANTTPPAVTSPEPNYQADQDHPELAHSESEPVASEFRERHEEVEKPPAESSVAPAPESAPAPTRRPERTERPHYPERPRYPDRQPAQPATIQGAIDEVNGIIEVLRESLEEMEEVLETLELAERQKDADEREIESLRRSLRQLQPRPREGGGSQGPRGH